MAKIKIIDNYISLKKHQFLTSALVLHRIVKKTPVVWEDVEYKKLKVALKLLQKQNRKFSTETNSVGSVILTFDDGNESDYLLVYPLLKHFNITALFFVITKYIGTPGYLTEKQIIEMHKNGMKFGSHSHSHRDLSKLGPSELRSELLLSKEILGRIIKEPVTRLSIPFGRFNKKVVSLAVDLGYEFIFCSKHGIVSDGVIINRNSINKEHTAVLISKIAFPSFKRQLFWKLEDQFKTSIKFLFPYSIYVKFRDIIAVFKL